MVAVLIALNILAGLFLIGVVLLQSGKGADMGAAFGGSSSTVFGASGAGNLLTKVTAGTAAVFMSTSLILAVISTRDQSVFANAPEPATAAPAVPAPPDGLPTDGVDAKAAAEARGQEPLVADETDMPGGAEAPVALPGSAPADLGPAGQAGEEAGAAVASDASPPASDSPAAGVAADAPAGGGVESPAGSAVQAPAGQAPANPAGAAPAGPAGDTPPNPAAGPTPTPAPAPAGAGAQQ